MTYAGELAGEALRLFGEWSKQLPDELTASIAVIKYPSLPQVPEALRGKNAVILRAAFTGDTAEGERLMRPWLDWQTPRENTLRQMPFREIGSIQNDPVTPTASYATNETFDELSDAVVDIIVRYATRDDSPLLYTEIRQGGGAMARRTANASPIGTRAAAYYFLAGGITPTPQASAAVEAYARQYKAELKPYVRGSVYLNFMRGGEVRHRTPDAYLPADYERLLAVKAQYDPTNRFRYSYPLASPGTK